MTIGANFEPLAETLRLAVAALRDAHVPFVVGGSLAAWARGGPEPQHDLDVMLKPADAEAALRVLEGAGMRPERPPEEWLYKAWNGDVMIDLIFQPSGLEMTDEVFERADTIALLAVATPVMALEDVLSTKLHALTEHTLDYTDLVAIARAVREQIDWPQLRARTADTPFAGAFFTLVEDLAIVPGHAARGISPGSSRVRVVQN
ncbi:MAG TPA: nucleotidyltransferase family protein [Solirubrobacteraceae bacterium]